MYSNKRNYNLFYGSSVDRGFEHLIRMWPDIKKAVPEATLHWCYGTQTFESMYRTNPERMAWLNKIKDLAKAEGVTNHGRLGFNELTRVRKQCGIWAYPTDFTEINCITALECQRDKVVPVVIELAALEETVGSGIKIKGDIWDKTVRETYKNELIGLMKDRERWLKESEKAREFAKKYDWDRVASQWEVVFNA